MLSWTLAAALAAGPMSVCAEEEADKALADGMVNAETASNYITDDFSNDMQDTNYTMVSQSQSSPYYQGEPICVPAAENFRGISGTEMIPDEFGIRGGNEDVVKLEIHDSGIVTVDAPETAR